jgi:acyl carrier protein
MTSVSAEITKIIAEALAIDPAMIAPETEVRTLPGADSMKMLEVIMSTEKRFKIELPDELPFNITTVGEFVSVVEKVVAGEHAGDGTAASHVA